MKRILITGANGLLGQKLVYTLRNRYEVVASGVEKDFVFKKNKSNYIIFDITNPTHCKQIVDNIKPNIIINAASITNVDECEIKRELCWNVNVKGVENLASAAKRNMALLIHISTDYIFDGKDGPYTEEDRPNPIGYYGKAKLASENVCRMMGVPFAIIRTSVLFGLGISVKQNFFLWLNTNLKQGKDVNIVTDQFNTPTLVDDLVSGILKLIQSSAYGLYHMSGKDYINRYDFAITLANSFGYDKSLIHPITTKSLNQQANRPMKGGLKVDKAMNEINYNPKAIDEVFDYLKTQLQDGK